MKSMSERGKSKCNSRHIVSGRSEPGSGGGGSRALLLTRGLPGKPGALAAHERAR